MAASEDAAAFLSLLSSACAAGRAPGAECLLRVFDATLRMLQVRGYADVSTPLEGIDRHAAPQLAATRLAECAALAQPVAVAPAAAAVGRPRVVVLFHTSSKVGIRVVRAIEDAYGSEVLVCVVSLEGPTPCTKKGSGESTPVGGRRIQYLTYAQVLRDPSSHCMVPKHRRLDAAERGAVEARYNIAQDANWPKIPTKDPVCRFYDFTPGDLLEIERVGLVSCGDQRYYRLVVASPA